MRLFIALPLPEDIRHDLAALQTRLPAGRPVAQENLHLTLAFLGRPTAGHRRGHPRGARHAQRLLPRKSPCKGPKSLAARHGQAVALGADCGAPLYELHDRVRGRLRSVGVQPERRRFRPHVTLARLSGHANAAPSLQTLVPAQIGPFTCPAFALFASTLHSRRRDPRGTGALPTGMTDIDTFYRMAQTAIDSFPEPFRTHAASVLLRVEDWPEPRHAGRSRTSTTRTN